MNVFILLKLVASTILSWFMSSPYDFTPIDVNVTPPQILKSLKSFESSFKYPFSDKEEFTIQHGKSGDYFSFFKQLGSPYYYVVTCKTPYTVTKKIDGKDVTIEHKKGEFIAVVCLVLRNITTTLGETKNGWYICDLKVSDQYQGEHIPLQICQQIAVGKFWQCPRGYAICMNPPSGDPKAASIFKKHGPISGLQTDMLNLYSLSATQVREHRHAIETSLKLHGYLKQDQHISFQSTAGAKDYQIKNKDTNASRPWNLIHITRDKNGLEPHEGATHMISAIEGSPLNKELNGILGAPSSTAQVISYGMKDVDFNFLTSNQI